MPEVFVRYEGGREATAPLAAGQTTIWTILGTLPPDDVSMNMTQTVPLRPGTTVEAVADALRVLLHRHEALRTRFRAGPGGDPHQYVAPDAVLPITLVDAGPDADRHAEQVRTVLADQPFRVAEDLPMRARLLLRDGRPSHLVLAWSHLSVDGWSRAVLLEELDLLLTGRGGELPEVREQPVDRTAYELSPEGQRRRRAALSYLRGQLETLPQQFFDTGPVPTAADYDSGAYDSPVAARALDLVSRDHRVPPGICLQATVALVVGLHVGVRDSALWVITSTRFRAPSRRLVTAANQNALIRPDWTAEDYGGFLAAFVGRALLGYRNCEYDYLAMLALADEVAADRGARAPRGWNYNDSSRGPVPAPAPDAPPAVTGSVYTPIASHDGQIGHNIFFRVCTQTAAEASWMISVDRNAVLPGGAERFVRDVETVLVAAAGGGLTIDRAARLIGAA